MEKLTTHLDDEGNIVLKISKSDIKKILLGNYSVNVNINQESKKAEKKNTTNPILDENIIDLSARELEVLKRIMQGKKNNQIAKELVLSPHTVKAHVARILHKLNVKDRVQAVVKAISEKIIEI